MSRPLRIACFCHSLVSDWNHGNAHFLRGLCTELIDSGHDVPRERSHDRDVVWIGNWGDEERTAELEEFFIRPVRDLGLSATACGVRYPPDAIGMLESAGIEYRGWLPNFRVPDAYATHRLTLHIPRRPCAELLAGIPTIRMFEAFACEMPLICSPWSDAESLFEPGDFLAASDGDEMKRLIRREVERPLESIARARRARATLLDRHTCARRAGQLIDIAAQLGVRGAGAGTPAAGEVA